MTTTISPNPARAAASNAAAEARALERGGTAAAIVKAAKAEGEQAAQAYLDALTWELDHDGETPPPEIVAALRTGMQHFGLSADAVADDLAVLREVRRARAAIEAADAEIVKQFDRSPADYNAAANEQSRKADEVAEPFLRQMTAFRVRASKLMAAVAGRNRYLTLIPPTHPRLSALIDVPAHKDASEYFPKT